MARTVAEALAQRRQVLVRNLGLYRNRPKKVENVAAELRRISERIGDFDGGKGV